MKFFKYLIFYFVVFFSLNVSAKEYIIALASDYPASFNRENLSQNIIKFVLSELKAGDNFLLISNTNFSTIASFNLPNKKGYDGANVKRKKFRKGLLAIKKYILALPLSEEQVAHSLLSEPQLLKHLSMYKFDNVPEEAKHINILLVGNGLYKDVREPGFNMREGWFPTDGHIRVHEKQSIYGTANKANFLKGVRLHHLVTNAQNEWYSDLYRLRIKRFWSLFINSQGGQLATFTSDLTTAFDRFKKHSTSVEQFSFDHTANKVEMLKATRITVPIGELSHNPDDDLTFMDDNTIISTHPPVSQIGKLKVGIRWPCKNCDLDLYAKSKVESQYLYYSNVETSEGKYYKDFTSSPDTINGLEYIQFTKDVNVREMDIKVNFYNGYIENGASGIVRAEYENKVYEQPFVISMNSGNKGGDDSRYWAKISLSELLSL